MKNIFCSYDLYFISDGIKPRKSGYGCITLENTEATGTKLIDALIDGIRKAHSVHARQIHILTIQQI